MRAPQFRAWCRQGEHLRVAHQHVALVVVLPQPPRVAHGRVPHGGGLRSRTCSSPEKRRKRTVNSYVTLDDVMMRASSTTAEEPEPLSSAPGARWSGSAELVERLS